MVLEIKNAAFTPSSAPFSGVRDTTPDVLFLRLSVGLSAVFTHISFL